MTLSLAALQLGLRRAGLLQAALSLAALQQAVEVLRDAPCLLVLLLFNNCEWVREAGGATLSLAALQQDLRREVPLDSPGHS